MASIFYFKNWLHLDHDRRIWGGEVAKRCHIPPKGFKKQNYTTPFPIVRATQRIENFVFQNECHNTKIVWWHIFLMLAQNSLASLTQKNTMVHYIN